MNDTVDADTRSRMMAGIRSRNTRPERMVRSALHRQGLRFRLRAAGLPCRPDLVLPRHRVALLVHGCYWHRHPDCVLTTTPRTRAEFWNRKFEDNMVRDQGNLRALQEAGWRVAVIWECGLRDTAVREGLLEHLGNWIRTTDDWFLELPQVPVRRRSDARGGTAAGSEPTTRC